MLMATHTENTPTMMVRSAERGHICSIGGVRLRTRLGSTDTAAAFVLLDVTLPPYWDACALHWHAHTMEMMYVLNGTLACTLGDTTTTAAAGTAILIPPGIVHTIWNPTAMPAVYLAWVAPGDGGRNGDGDATRAASAPRHPPTPPCLRATLSATRDVLLAHPDRNDGGHPQ